MNKTTLLVLCTGLQLVLICNTPVSGQQANRKRPNIIYIMTDDQSPIPILEETCDQSRPFGFNGDPNVHTPVIDSLAKNGMIFTRAYVSSSVCSPSRYSMLTGRYAGRSEGNRFMKLFPYGSPTRIENNTELEQKRDNLPRLLQRAGYRTGFVGKSHVVDHHLLPSKSWEQNGLAPYSFEADPNDPAISRAMSYNHRNWARRILDYGFDYANAVYAANLKELHNDSLNVHNIEWKVNAALEFIREVSKESFFLYYSETVPHGPAPWEKPDGKYKYGLDANPKFTGEGKLDRNYSFMPPREQIQAETEAAGKDPDHAWLRWFDHAVGAIVQTLKEEGILENTLIVISSDHGNFDFGKSTLYEGGVKVPLLMYWPEGIQAGTVYDELVQNIDFAPNFLDLAGFKSKSSLQMDGVSLKEVLGGDEEAVHDYLFFELGFARGVATKEWKYIAVRYDEATQKEVDQGKVYTGWNDHQHELPYYIRNSHLGYHAALLNPNYFHQDQLYDMKKDPKETTNLYGSKSRKEKQMKELLVKSLESFPDRPYGEFVKQ